MTLSFLFFGFDLDPPNITRISENKTVNQSDPVNLTCRADGNPKPTITWMKNGKVVNKSFIVRGKSAEGLYICTADNGIGKASSKPVFITVECKSKCKASSTFIQTNRN